MKKKTNLLILLPLLSLASCVNNNSTSTYSTSSSNSSSTISTSASSISSSSSTIVPKEWDVYDIYDILKEASSGNFTFAYTFENKDYEDIYTSKYIYKGYTNIGNVLLPINNENCVFDFSLVNNQIDLKGQSYSESNGTQGVDSLNDLNELVYLFKNNSFTVDEIFDDDGFYINSQNVIDAYSNLLDFSSIEKITFEFNNNDLILNLMAKDLDGSFFIPDGGSVTLKNIGSSSIESIETFLTNFNISSPLNNSIKTLDSSFSYSTNLYTITNSTGEKTYEGQENLDSNNNYYRLVNKNKENKIYSDIVLMKNENETLNQITIDGTNTVSNTQSTLYPTFNDFNLININKLDTSNFILQSNNEYLYLGSNANSIAQSLVKDSRFIKYRTSKITLVTSNNKIKNITIDSEYLKDSETNEIFYYQAQVEFLNTVKQITVPNKKIASGNNELIKEYFNNIQKEDSNFIATKIDSSWEGKRITRYTKTSNIYMIQTYIVSEVENTLESGRIYYLKNKKLYEFQYVAGEAKIIGTPMDSTLSTKVNFSVSSEIFYIDNQILKTYDDIHYIGSNIAFTDYPLDVISSSLKMIVENNYINKIELEYSNKEINGSETINIEYNTATISNELQETLDNQIPASKERNTWNDDKSDVVYGAFLDSFLKDKADLVPYLPNDKLSGSFDGYENDTNDFRIYSMGEGLSEEEINNYINDYKELLIELGYTTSDNKTYTNTTDNLQIIVGETLDEFLQIGLMIG